MITEDYVSFETAKLLKSKKFHIPIRSHYDSRGGFGFFDICEIDWNNYKCFRERRCYSAPTLQMARKWLIEVHKIYIDISPTYSEVEKTIHFIWQIFDSNYDGIGDCEIFYDKYETACESAIRYTLETLI